MRKVVSNLFISLDGVVEDPSWTFEYAVDEGDLQMAAHIADHDTVLMGRGTYEGWAAYWPTSKDEPFASFINNVPKYVVSTTLDQVDWQNSTLLKGDLAQNVQTLKQQPGKNIAVSASPTLVHSLIEVDLLDELHLVVYPVIVGKGKRLFQDNSAFKKLKLVETKPTSSGILFLTYQFA